MRRQPQADARGDALPVNPARFAPLPPADASELLRGLAAHDPVRALSLAFVPDAMRAAALTACAFVAEAAGIPARVSDPTIGLIRVQWWHEALEEAFGEGAVRAHPLVRALRLTVSPPHRAPLEQALSAIPPFLEGGHGAPADLLCATDGAMGRLVASLVSPQADPGLAEEASVVAALAQVVATPPPPARSPQIETPRQRASRMARREAPDVRARLADLKTAWAGGAADGVVLGALPVAVAERQASGRPPGPLRTRLLMTRMVARGRP